MKANIFTCNNFRNLQNQSVELSDGMNVIYGENAQGKTNFLEGIWLFTGAKSFRYSKDEQMILTGKDSAKITLDYEKNGINNKSEITFGIKKQVTLNNKKVRSRASLAGEFLSIIFSPNDLNLVLGEPNLRRRFIDAAICQIYPRYIDILKNYTRAVTQKNSMLKSNIDGKNIDSILDAFDSEISVLGEKLVTYRLRYVELLNEVLPKIYSGISSGREEISVFYHCTCPDGITNAMKNARNIDIRRGFCTVGPHRDDILFKINGSDVKTYGSQGQKRSVCLSLKLAEAQIIKKSCNQQPIALLDDVMSELDPSRQEFILNHIKDWQVFITCCDPGNINRLNSGSIYHVTDGVIKKG